MEGNRTIEALEEELKLLKGEMKQSLASVRDYLLNMELPSSEFATVLAALGGENDVKMTLSGGLMPPQAPQQEKEPENEVEELPEESISEEHEEFEDPGSGFNDAEESFTPDDPVQEVPEDDQPAATSHEEPGSFGYSDRHGGHGSAQETSFMDEGDPFGDMSEEAADALHGQPEDELGGLGELDDNLDDLLEEDFDTGLEDAAVPELFTEEDIPMEQLKVSSEMEQSIPKVNLLANLMGWVARAKRDIGHDQIPMLLEVYGISGNLSPELKDIILHLADITGEQQEPSAAEVWSQTLSSLHGVLTGGEAPLFPLKPCWGEADDLALNEDEIEETEVERASDQPVKLKLVFPGSDGKGKEFCIDLAPETSQD